MISEFLVEEFFNNAKINTIEEKHDSFFENVEKLHSTSKNQLAILKSLGVFYKFVSEAQIYRYKFILYLFGLVLNILTLFYYDNKT